MKKRIESAKQMSLPMPEDYEPGLVGVGRYVDAGRVTDYLDTFHQVHHNRFKHTYGINRIEDSRSRDVQDIDKLEPLDVNSLKRKDFYQN